MDAPPSRHPTDQSLGAFGLGKLDGPSAEAVSAHLVQCPDCRRRVAELSADSFLGRVRDARRPSGLSATGPSRIGGDSGAEGRNAPARPPSSTLPPGLVDHPDYEIKRELGRGGMGVVYLAYNTLMGRDEVLKVMGRHLMERPGVFDRFVREVRAVAQLRHPNIVAAYTAFRLDGDLVFAMEYVEGLDLSRLVKSKGPLPVGHAAYFVHQAALGLQHAHEKGTVHRDIKPHNLMITHDGKARLVKVLDFGLAKATREEKVDAGLTHEGQALGTPDYIAPEQIVNAPNVDIRADLYSLGGTLFYLLTGRPPFRANSLYDIYQAHISRDADPLNLVRPEVPAELAALVAKMMAKDPARRFQTPGEVAQALAPFFKPARGSTVGVRSDLSQAGPPAVASGSSAIGTVATQPATNVTPPPSPPTPPAVSTTRTEANWESLIEIRETERSKEPAPAVSPGRRPPWSLPALAAGVLLFVLIAVWAAGALRVKTPEGDLVFADLPEQSVVTVDGKVTTVDWPGGKGPARVTVPAGDHRVKVELNGVEVLGETVKIAAGEKTWLVVRFEPRVGNRPGAEIEGGASKSDVESPRPTFDPTRFTALGGGRWERDGDVLFQSDADAKFPVLMFGDDRWTDYDFTAEFMRLQGPSDVSMLVRCTGDDDNLRFAVSAKGDWKHSLIEATEPGETYRWLKHVIYPIISYQWYSARVRVRGNRVESWLFDDGKEVVHLEAEDDKHPRGRVGFRTWHATYKFRNIKVTAPDGKVLWDGPPAVVPRTSLETLTSSPDARRPDAVVGASTVAEVSTNTVSTLGLGGVELPTFLAAYRTPSAAPLADGIIRPGEYPDGTAVDFTAGSRLGALAPGMGDARLTKTPDDLSLRVYTAYTDTSLFVAVQVRDQFLKVRESEKEQPFFNDGVELFIDGDQVSNDFTTPAGQPPVGSSEGFQLVADAAGHKLTISKDFTNNDWKAAAGRLADGYVVEFEVPLRLIDRQDGPGMLAAGPGALLHVALAVNDNDVADGRHMSYAYLRADKSVGLPFFGREGVWSLGIRLLEPMASQAGGAASGADFVPLFNGKDLTGWGFDIGPRDTWRVEEGDLVTTGPGDWRRSGFLLSSRDYRDFVLHFEFQVKPGTKVNSGVAFWAAAGDIVKGLSHPLQIELLDRDEPVLKNGSFFWSTSLRLPDTLPPDRPARLRPSGEWNTAELEVRGNSLRYTVNGRDVLQADLRKLAGRPGRQPGLMRRSGRIGLQTHTGTMRFRNIEIREMNGADGASGSSTTAAEGPTRPQLVKPAVRSAAKKPGTRRSGTRRPADAKEFQGISYKVFPQQLTWHEARVRCQNLGGHLAVVRSEEENRFLTSLLKGQDLAHAWLGATDERVEGRWVWVDGTPMRYSNWGTQQPNNKQGLEHYVVLRADADGKWSDQPNASTQHQPGFVCQWD